MKRIDLTQAIRDALDLVARADAIYRPGLDSASMVEIPKLALADAILAAVGEQTRRLDRLPERAQMVGVIEGQARRKRRRG